VKQTDIAGFANEVGVSASEAQVALLASFEATLVGARAGSLGLISKHDRGRIRERHIFDCIRAAVPAPARGLAYDLGSGGGLPGMVVAILRPQLSLKLVERRSLRAAFLEWVVGDLHLANVEVEACGIEDLPAGKADACFARALAPLERSWALASDLLAPAGQLIYFAGAGAELPDSLPKARSIRALPSRVLESAGPLAIITR
jgi:16S rRNA (guanine527-N7)-methyltransferase